MVATSYMDLHALGTPWAVRAALRAGAACLREQWREVEGFDNRMGRASRPRPAAAPWLLGPWVGSLEAVLDARAASTYTGLERLMGAMARAHPGVALAAVVLGKPPFGVWCGLQRPGQSMASVHRDGGWVDAQAAACPPLGAALADATRHATTGRLLLPCLLNQPRFQPILEALRAQTRAYALDQALAPAPRDRPFPKI